MGVEYNFSGSQEEQRAEVIGLLKDMRKHMHETFIAKIYKIESTHTKYAVHKDNEYSAAIHQYLALRSFYQEKFL